MISSQAVKGSCSMVHKMFLFFSHCFLSIDCLFRWLESYTYIKSCNRDSLWLLNWYLQLENLCLNASKVMDPLCKLKFFTIRDIGFIKSISTLSSCLQYKTKLLILQTISDFPMLNYINEPMSHLAYSDVRLAMRHLPAAAHHNCGVPGNIHEAHFSFRPSRSSVSDDSTTFRRNKVLHCNSL